MLHSNSDAIQLEFRHLAKDRSNLELSNAATIAWYCCLVVVVTPAFACLGYCWYQKCQSHRRAMVALERESELEQMSRIEANVQIFSESERMRRIRRIQVAMANQVRRLTTSDLKRQLDRQERMMKHEEQQHGPAIHPNDDKAHVGDDQDNKNNDVDVDNDKGDEGTTTQACSICLEDFQLGESVAHSSNDSCPHLFHEKCIIAWLAERQDGFCPYCRRSFLCLPPMTSRTSIGSQDHLSTVMEDVENGRPELNGITPVEEQPDLPGVSNGDETTTTDPSRLSSPLRLDT